MRADKLDSFRKEIRRGQIDSFIGKKRIRMMQHLREEAAREKGNQLGPGMDLELEREAVRDIDPAFMSVQQLKRIAQLVQTEPGIEIIRKADYEPHFHKYLSPEYINSEEQCYSTLILCNLYYLTSNCPSEALTRQISGLLAEADMRSLENIFFLIGNTISDFPGWLSDLLNIHQFGEALPGLFKRFERPTLDYLNHLVHMIFKVVQMAGKHSSFLKLKQPLLKMIMQKENEDVKELMRKAVYAYYCLFKAFPQEVGPIMVKYGVLARLIYLTPFFNERRIVNLVLETIQLTLHEFTQQDFQNNVIPFLIQLSEVGFELGEVSKVFQPRHLKLITYRIVYKALECEKIGVQHFSGLKLSMMMLQEFQASQDAGVLVDLAYIFVHVYLNTKNQFFREHVRRLLERAKRYNPNNYEFGVYLNQFERM